MDHGTTIEVRVVWRVALHQLAGRTCVSPRSRGWGGFQALE